MTSKASVSVKTGLWSLARELGKQVAGMLEQDQHLVFSQAKQQFETDTATAELANSTEPDQVLDVLVRFVMSEVPPVCYLS